MNSDLYFEGKKYISTRRVAEVSGYSTDYIGQLCRAKNLECKMVGRNWFVSETSLAEYQNSFSENRKKDSSFSNDEADKNISSSRDIRDSLNLPSQFIYSFDEKPLIPKIEKHEDGGGEKVKIKRNTHNGKDYESPICSDKNLKIPSRNFQRALRGGQSLLILTAIIFSVILLKDNSLLKDFYKKSPYLTELDQNVTTIIGGVKSYFANSNAKNKNKVFTSETSPRLLNDNFALLSDERLSADVEKSPTKVAPTDFLNSFPLKIYNGLGVFYKLTNSTISSFSVVSKQTAGVVSSVLSPVGDFFNDSFITAKNYLTNFWGGNSKFVNNEIIPIKKTFSNRSSSSVSSTKVASVAPSPNSSGPITYNLKSTTYNLKPDITRREVLDLIKQFDDNSKALIYATNAITGENSLIVNKTVSDLKNKIYSLEQKESLVPRQVDHVTNIISRSFSDITSLDGVTMTNSSFSGTTGTFTDVFSGASGTFSNNLTIGSQLTVSGTGTSTIAGDTNFDSGTLYIDSIDNRVGIASSSPSETLSINGATYLSQISAPSVTTGRLYNTSGDLYWAGNLVGSASVGNWTLSGGNVYRSSGSVGIGTTSPYAKLSVEGSSALGNSALAGYFTATTSTASVFPYASTTQLTVAGSSWLNGLSTIANLLLTGSTTLQNFTANNSTTTNATSTNLAISGNLNVTGNTILTNSTSTNLTVTSTASTTDLIVSNNAILSKLTASRLLSVNSSRQISNTDLNSWVLGTINQLTVADNSNGTVTLSLPSQLSLTQASTTLFSSLDGVFVGRTSTTTIRGDGLSSIIPYASTTAITATTASTTNLIVSLNSTLGTVSSGLWNGTTVGVGYGGTGLTAYTLGDVLYASGTGTLAGTSTANLKATLALNNVENTALSTWAGTTNITTLGTITSGTWNATKLGVPYGGTGWAAIQSGTIPYGNGSGALSTTTAGTAGNILALLNGVPTWTATSTLAEITGTLSIAKGGTNQTTYPANVLIGYNGTSFIATGTPQLTVGNILATSTTATSTFAGGFSAGNNAAFVVNQAAGANSLYINPSGNVGIGTASPGANLHIVPTSGVALKINRVGGFQSIVGDTDLVIDSASNNKLYLNFYSNGDALIAYGGGNVGIGGTTTPAAKFSVGGAAGDTTGHGYFTGGLGVGTLNTTAGTLQVSGSVGIGTTSPYAKLSVEGSSALGNSALAGYFTATTSTASVFPYASTTAISASGSAYFATSGGNVGIGTTSPWAKLAVNPVAGDVNQFVVGSSTVTSFVITPAGNVGIGTMGPLYKLHVNGSFAVQNNDAFFGDVASGAYLDIGNLGDTAGWIDARGSGTNVGMNFRTKGNGDFTFKSASADLVTVKSTGNVGIGRTAPAYPLDVLGTGTGAIIARFNDANTTGCTLATGGTISCSSDISLKKNIEDIGDGLNKVLGLHPVLFNWKAETDSSSNLKNLGFIAQEVEPILPKLVSTEENGIKQLNTIGMIPLLTKAIQEQQGMIEGLKQAMASTTALIAGLSATNGAQSSGVVSQSFDWFIAQFKNIGIAISNGVIQSKEFVADKITAKKVVAESFEIKDSATGEAYCVKITNGEWNKIKGACGSSASSVSSSVSLSSSSSLIFLGGGGQAESNSSSSQSSSETTAGQSSSSSLVENSSSSQLSNSSSSLNSSSESNSSSSSSAAISSSSSAISSSSSFETVSSSSSETSSSSEISSEPTL